jgi:formyl-CoA transferase
MHEADDGPDAQLSQPAESLVGPRPVGVFETAGVPSGPINTIDKALTDPHITARGLLAEVDGRKFTRAPLQFSKTPVSVRSGPPPLGSASRQVLSEAGLAAEEIDRLVRDGVLGAGEEVKA